MKESEKWLALCDPSCQQKKSFPNCECCDIALEYRYYKQKEKATGETRTGFPCKSYRDSSEGCTRHCIIQRRNENKSGAGCKCSAEVLT